MCLCLAIFKNQESNGVVLQGGQSFFRGVLANMEAVYLSRNPTAKSVLELVGSDEQISYDHFAFRTFGVDFLFDYQY